MPCSGRCILPLLIQACHERGTLNEQTKKQSEQALARRRGCIAVGRDGAVTHSDRWQRSRTGEGTVVSTSLLRNATWANGFAFNHFLANGREVAWESRPARPQRIGVAARNAPVPLPAHASTADTHTFITHTHTHTSDTHE